MLNTKKDYQDCLIKMIKPLRKYYTKGKAGIKCGSTGVHYGDKTARIEAFARPLWGLGPLWGGKGECEDFDKIYLEGIINGTNPDHEEYWGIIEDFHQKIVETAAMGLALVLAPDKLWDPLTDKQKENLHKWLWQVNEVESVDNNWQFFAVLVNLGLKNVGTEYDEGIIKHAISRFNSFYLGNGWYSDGNTDQIDYYISFAMHFYSLIYAKVAEKDDPENSRIFKERAKKFAQDFIYWFAEDGSAIAFGRSLTYRFAQCCFWSACVFAGIEPFPMGVMKGIISRHIEYWMNLPIFDNDGILTIGYGYPNIAMSESYNAYGSPYWAMKSFLILALDDDHKFFKEKAQPLPKLEKLHVIPEARMVIQRINGYVTAITAGQWAGFEPVHTPEKYSKFAYSSKFAFSVPRSYYKLENAGSDSMLVFVSEDNMCYVRKKCIDYKISEDGCVYSEWSPCYGVNVKTNITPTDDGHIRKHVIECDRDWTVYDCSFAVINDIGVVTGKDGEEVTIDCTVNTNLLNTNTKMGAVKYNIKKGISEIVTKIIYPAD